MTGERKERKKNGTNVCVRWVTIFSFFSYENCVKFCTNATLFESLLQKCTMVPNGVREFETTSTYCANCKVVTTTNNTSVCVRAKYDNKNRWYNYNFIVQNLNAVEIIFQVSFYVSLTAKWDKIFSFGNEKPEWHERRVENDRTNVVNMRIAYSFTFPTWWAFALATIYFGYVFNRFDKHSLCAAKYLPNKKSTNLFKSTGKLTKICLFFGFASSFWKCACVEMNVWEHGKIYMQNVVRQRQLNISLLYLWIWMEMILYSLKANMILHTPVYIKWHLFFAEKCVCVCVYDVACSQNLIWVCWFFKIDPKYERIIWILISKFVVLYFACKNVRFWTRFQLCTT